MYSYITANIGPCKPRTDLYISGNLLEIFEFFVDLSRQIFQKLAIIFNNYYYVTS